MPAALPDVLSCDGQHIYMRSQKFDLDCKRPEIRVYPKSGINILEIEQKAGAHLYAPAGFLDDAEFNRNYWVYGTTHFEGHQGESIAGRFTPSGQILAFNDGQVFGYRGEIKVNAVQNVVFAINKAPKQDAQAPAAPRKENAADKKPEKSKKTKNDKKTEAKTSLDISLKYNWTQKPVIAARAIALTGQTLALAGTDSKDNHKMVLYSTDGGKVLSEVKLPAQPVFDGMASAKGRVYLSLANGNVACFGKD